MREGGEEQTVEVTVSIAPFSSRSSPRSRMQPFLLPFLFFSVFYLFVSSLWCNSTQAAALNQITMVEFGFLGVFLSTEVRVVGVILLIFTLVISSL